MTFVLHLMYIKIHCQLTMLSCNNRYFQLFVSMWVHFTTLPAQTFAYYCNFIHMHPLLHFHHAPKNQTRWTPRAIVYLWNPKNHFYLFLQKKKFFLHMWVHFTSLPAHTFAYYCNFIHVHPLLHFHHAPKYQTRKISRAILTFFCKKNTNFLLCFFSLALMLPPSKNSWYYRVAS